MKYITHELAHIWITSDGRKFVEKDKAQKHQDAINKCNFITWLSKNGDFNG